MVYATFRTVDCRPISATFPSLFKSAPSTTVLNRLTCSSVAARSAGEFEKKEVEESRSKAAQYLSTKSGQIQTNPEGWVRPHLPRGAAPPGAVLRARRGPCARSAFARARRSVASASLSLRDQETLPRGSPSPLALLAPPVSRERLHSIACSWPRSFRRVARLGLSLRASKRSLRVAFGSPPLTIPMGWQDMHCGVQTVVPTVCPSQ